MGTPISHEQKIKVHSDGLTSGNEMADCANDRFATYQVPQKAAEMSGCITSIDCGRAADAEIESRHSGNGVESCGVEFSSDCQKCLQYQKIPGASQKERLGDRLANDLAVPRNSAVLPSDNAVEVSEDSSVGIDSALSMETVAETVVGCKRGEKCLLCSDDTCTTDESVHNGAVPPSAIGTVVPRVPNLRDRRARERLWHIIGTSDDNSQFADDSMQNLAMDQFGHIYEMSDSNYDEFSADETEVSSQDTGISGIVDKDVDNSAASDAIEKEIGGRKSRNNFESQTVDFTNSADFSDSRPRREIRRRENMMTLLRNSLE